MCRSSGAPGARIEREQSRWGGNEVRACDGNAGKRGRAEGSGGRTVGDVRDEELDDAIDLEIEKVRTTYRTDFSGRSKGRSIAGPRGSVCREVTDPGSDAHDPSPGRSISSEFHITQWF